MNSTATDIAADLGFPCGAIHLPELDTSPREARSTTPPPLSPTVRARLLREQQPPNVSYHRPGGAAKQPRVTHGQCPRRRLTFEIPESVGGAAASSSAPVPLAASASND